MLDPGIFLRLRCLFLAISVTLGLSAQITWQRAYGGYGADRACSVDTTAGGGFVVLGSTGSFGAGNGDIYLIKLDSMGELEWSRTYGGPSVDEGRSIATLDDGGLLIAGTTFSTTMGYDGLLIRTDPMGNMLWEKHYGGTDWEFVSDARPITGGYILAGQSFGTAGGSGDAWMIKTDLAGDTTWTRSYSSPGLDELRCVRATVDGGFVVAGTSERAGGDHDIMALKYSAFGAFQWDAFMGGDSLEIGYGIAPTVDGGFAVSGSSESFWPYRAMCLYKLNTAGNEQWVQTTTGPGGDWEGRGLIELANGDLAIAGYTEAYGAGGRDVYMWHTDAIGGYIEGPTFGGLSDEEGWGVVATTDGGYVVVGTTNGFGPGILSVFAVRHYGAPLASPVVETFDPLPVLELVDSGNDVGFYPNPALSEGEVTFADLDLTERWSISLFHASGQLVLKDRPLQKDRFTLPDLAPGIYTLTLKSGAGEVRSRLCVQ